MERVAVESDDLLVFPEGFHADTAYVSVEFLTLLDHSFEKVV
jgi:hypothetical protein